VTNRNDPAIGDGWNQEDLSIWSADQADSDHPDAGARALEGFCRPFVRAADGTIRSVRYALKSGRFEAIIEGPASGEAEIYLPAFRYGSDGSGGQLRKVPLEPAGQTRISFEPAADAVT
jgi:hypothetical protein